MSRKIAYLVAYEKPNGNPLLHTQVYDLLKVIKAKDTQLGIHIIFVLSLITFLKNLIPILKIKHELERGGIKVKFILDFHWVRSIYMTPLQVQQMRKRMVPKLGKCLDDIDPDLIHCRSYLAQDIAVECDKTPTIFDPRSSYIDECLFLKLFKRNSNEHRWWTNREQELIQRSRNTVVISLPFIGEIKAKSQRTPVYIPLISDVRTLVRNSKKRTQVRRKLKLNEEFTFIFVGQIGKWHQIDLIVDTYSKLDSFFTKPTKLIIVGVKDKKFSKILSSEQIIPIQPVPHQEIAKYYCASDAGLLIIPQGSSSHRNILSTKFTEYCAAGLVPIVNVECGGASEIIKKYNCGCVIDTENLSSIEHASHSISKNFANMSINARKAAKNEFDIDLISGKYHELYMNRKL
ncbi:MAG: glycosyltransferase [Waddliaceae bacterium]